MNWLELLDQLASIFTAVAALGAWLSYLCGRRNRRLALEHYLKTELPDRPDGKNTGARSVPHLMAMLRMPEADVLTAAFESSLVETARRPDDEGVTKDVLLRYRRVAAA